MTMSQVVHHYSVVRLVDDSRPVQGFPRIILDRRRSCMQRPPHATAACQTQFRHVANIIGMSACRDRCMPAAGWDPSRAGVRFAGKSFSRSRCTLDT